MQGELPSLALLDAAVISQHRLSEDSLQALSRLLELKLADFGVRCVVSDSATTGALQAEALNGDELRELRTGCQQVLVF